jgi:hypothetical protein
VAIDTSDQPQDRLGRKTLIAGISLLLCSAQLHQLTLLR